MKTLKPILLSTVAFLIFSCAGSDDAPQGATDVVTEVVDTYNLLTINSQGNVFLIGNNTGNLQSVAQIPSQSNMLQSSTM